MSPMMESMAHSCVLLKQTQTPDGEGGCVATWTDGAAFKAYPARDTSMRARIAEQQGVASVYTVLVPRNVSVEVGNYYRDETENAIFHVTSRPDEKKTPALSTLNLKAFTAEKAELPT